MAWCLLGVCGGSAGRGHSLGFVGCRAALTHSLVRLPSTPLPPSAQGASATKELLEARRALSDARAMAAEIAEESKGAAAAADGEDVWAETLAQAAADVEAATSTVVELEDRILEELLPRDLDDNRGAILEVRPGTGGKEASLFAKEVFHMYEALAQAKGWRWEQLDVVDEDVGGYR